MAASDGLRSIALDHSGILHLGQSLALWANACDNFPALGRLHVSLRQLELISREGAAPQGIHQTCATDFCFRWSHFRDFPRLVLFVKPGLPDPYDFDQETPIAQRRASDPLPPLLEKVFASEVARLTGPEPDYLPDPQTDDERLFFVTVCELCEPPRPKGAPKGRRYKDGLAVAVAEAQALIEEAERSDDVWNPELQTLEVVYQSCPVTVEEAARAVADRWKAQGRVMAPHHWAKLSFDDRKRVIVAADSRSDADGMAAQRRIREALTAKV